MYRTLINLLIANLYHIKMWDLEPNKIIPVAYMMGIED
jgi:hypothetical protein